MLPVSAGNSVNKANTFILKSFFYVPGLWSEELPQLKKVSPLLKVLLVWDLIYKTPISKCTFWCNRHLPLKVKWLHQNKSCAELWPAALSSANMWITQKEIKKPSPKLSFSWWALLGSLGPGTPGDSCFGTCYTPATATRRRRKSIGAETRQRGATPACFRLHLIPRRGKRKKLPWSSLHVSCPAWHGVPAGVWGYLGGLVLSPTHVAELAATAAPVLQLILQGPLALL